MGDQQNTVTDEYTRNNLMLNIEVEPYFRN